VGSGVEGVVVVSFEDRLGNYIPTEKGEIAWRLIKDKQWRDSAMAWQ
jgi:hypothetical protein